MNNTINEFRYAAESQSSDSQFRARKELQDLFRETPLPPEDLMVNLGLYVRGSALAKLLMLDELYRLIVDIPGTILEFGSWWGQNLVVFENLRAIYEPFNKTRVIIGFDTFSGHSGFGEKDNPGDVFHEGGYAVGENYEPYITQLLKVHEQNNVLGHITGMHSIIKGDVTTTCARYFEDHRETVVALAYFDMGLYEPTVAALRAIQPHLLPGSVILLDEFTWHEAPGEAIAFKEVFAGRDYSIRKSKYMPMRAIVSIR